MRRGHLHTIAHVVGNYPVSNTLTCLYDGIAFVANTLTGIYDIKGLVNQSVILKYDIKQLATQTLTNLYDIRQLVSNVLTGLYGIRRAFYLKKNIGTFTGTNTVDMGDFTA